MLSKVTRNWRNRVASMGGERIDLHEADVNVLDRNTARLLVGFNRDLGAPRTPDVDHFIRASFGGKVVPILESIRVHDAEGALHLLVTLDRPIMAAAEAGKRGLRQVNPMLFRSASSGEAWTLFDSPEGPQIIREADDDIGEIMAERAERRLEAGAGPLLLFAHLRTASRTNPMPGDEVEFYHQGQILDGTISSVGGDRTMTIKAFDGGSYTVPHEALGRVKKLGPQSLSDIQSRTQKYFSQVFPADPTMSRDISQVKPPAPGQIPEPSTSEVPGDMPLPRGAGRQVTTSAAPPPRTAAAREAGVSRARASVRSMLFGGR